MTADDNQSGVGTILRRRTVTSLSPARERHMLAFNRPHNGSSAGQLRPPLTQHGSLGKTKSSNLASGSRPPTKLPPLPRRSVAVSQEETCLVSAAGDVLVCRSREFAQLMGGSSVQYHSDADNSTPTNGTMRWCDLECSEFPMTLEKSSLCNPWLTRSIGQKEEKKEDDRAVSHHIPNGGLRGGGSSTYEWEDQTSDPIEQTKKAFGQLELEVTNSASNISSAPTTPRDPYPSDGGDDEDRVLSMPSFDYSHFGYGGNDMLPVSPVRTRTRRFSDSAEIDVKLSLKLHRNAATMERQTSRLNPSAFFSTNNKNHVISTTFTTQSQSTTPLFHGVPTFLTSISQVRIRQVSAHPRGSHVLMISAEALLFSYGLNDHGQLGIGIKSPAPGKCTESYQRYVWTPTIITPLLENGGKAITCAAGESHSLVVVSTEGRRILKSRSLRSDINSSTGAGSEVPIQMNRVSSSPPTMDAGRDPHGGDESEHSSSSMSAAESVWHHQLYGFGRNNFMKIGLVHPRRKPSPEQPMNPNNKASPLVATDSQLTDENHHNDMEDVLLPHRVALHCTVWPEKCSSIDENQTNGHCPVPPSRLPPQGIFALAASSEHSAALVRRATGDIELYTWGNAAYHSLGVTPTRTSSNLSSSNKIAPVPMLVKQLSYSATQDASRYAYSLLEQSRPEFPVDVSLGPYSSFVVTSKGRCLSFGISYDGMLGHGRGVTEVQEPRAIHFPGKSNNGSNSRISITSVSAGTGHVIALAKCGTVFTWGKNTDGRLGLGENHVATAAPDDTTTDLERAIEWTPQKLPALSKRVTPSRIPPSTNCSGHTSKPGGSEDEYGPVVQVCAGLDCSIFVTACGKVLSCGKHSGRLGLGEVNTDVPTPTPLFGGLSLWNRPAAARPTRREKASPSPAKKRPTLKRGMTTG